MGRGKGFKQNATLLDKEGRGGKEKTIFVKKGGLELEGQEISMASL